MINELSNFEISVVIPNYNGRKLLEENLPFVYEALDSSGILEYEVIIIDDASKDSSVAFVKDAYPSIQLIENQINLGFSATTNKGIRKAKKELVLILNTDVQLGNGYFKKLLPYFKELNTFGVMGVIKEMDSEEIQVGPKFAGYSYGKISPGKNYLPKSDKQTYTFYLSGANALINREKLIEIGLFNESFDPYYYEDVDLGIRAWRLGYSLFFEKEAVCRHLKSATIKKEGNKKIKITYKRNKFILHYLQLNGIELTYYFSLQVVKSFFRLLILDKKYLISFYQFVLKIPSLNKSKLIFKKLQEAKKVKMQLRDVSDIFRLADKI